MLLQSALVVASLLCAVVQAESGQEPPRDYVVVRDSGAAKITVHLHTSQILLVELSTQLGTGYDWTVSRCDTSLVECKRLSGEEWRLLQERGVLKNDKSANMPGSAELRIFQFHPLSSGKAEVEFHSIRPRQPEKVDKTLSLSINISR